MLNFTTIDFETANSYRGSPCSVGLVKIRDGKTVDEASWLIKPPAGADWFDRWNVTIHGITPEMVADQPRWSERLPEILDFVGDDILIAHNAAFDIGVIRYACAIDNIAWPELKFLCSMVLARRLMPLPSYRLPYVIESLGGRLDDHHDALADSKAVAEVITKLADNNDADDIESLVASAGIAIGQMRAGQYIGSVALGGDGGKLVQPALNPNADPNGYLYNRVVVFTGKLMSMTRQIAWDGCAKIGAIAESTTTKRTQVLVVGDINPAVLRPGSNVTGKVRRAFELQDDGQEIEVMTEDDFLRCLDGEPLPTAEDVIVEPDPETAPALQGLAPGRFIPIEHRRPQASPISERVLLPPRPLRRDPVPTDQICSEPACAAPAAFKTRSNPTWCLAHVDDIYRSGGLRRIEGFTHPQDWILTECMVCTVQCHYRFEYVIEKNSIREPVCRACYWRHWAAEQRNLLCGYIESAAVSFDEARAHAETHGYEYLGPLTTPSLSDDPHHTKCQRCGKVSAERLGDISFGCTCIPRK